MGQNSKTKVPVDQATPKISVESKGKPETIVTEGLAACGRVLASPNIGAASGVKSTATDWNNNLLDLQKNNTNKSTARANLDTAITNEPPLVRACNAGKLAVVAAINVFSKGSKDMVQSFAVDVEQRTAKPEATVPVNLRPMVMRKSATARARWAPTVGAEGYMVQHATNVADPTTYAAPVRVTKARYDLEGQTPGTTVYFRVAALDTALPGGQTAWTIWVGVFVPA